MLVSDVQLGWLLIDLSSMHYYNLWTAFKFSKHTFKEKHSIESKTTKRDKT